MAQATVESCTRVIRDICVNFMAQRNIVSQLEARIKKCMKALLLSTLELAVWFQNDPGTFCLLWSLSLLLNVFYYYPIVFS